MNAPIDISGVTLRTPRLLLRPWQESDLDDFYEYASVDGVGQMAGWLPHKDKAESARILKMFIDEKKTLALEFEGKVIGSIGIERYDEEKLPEMAPPALPGNRLCSLQRLLGTGTDAGGRPGRDDLPL